MSNPYASMTDAQINRLVAERCGWRECSPERPSSTREEYGWEKKLDGRLTVWGSTLCHYAGSLEHCRTFEDRLKRRASYFLVMADLVTGRDDGWSDADMFALITATARQRCEAFLLTTDAAKGVKAHE